MAKRQLNAKHIRFCTLIVEGFGSSYQCYVEVFGEKPAGRNATDQAVMRLVRNQQIKSYILELRQQAADAAKVNLNRFVQELAREAFADRTQIYDERGNVRHPSEWPPDVRACFLGGESEEQFKRVESPDGRKRKELTGHVRKVKMSSRTAAQRLLAEVLGYLKTVGAEAAAAPGAIVVEKGPLDVPPPPEEG